MANIVGQLGRITGSLDIWLNITRENVCEAASKLALLSGHRHHPI